MHAPSASVLLWMSEMKAIIGAANRSKAARGPEGEPRPFPGCRRPPRAKERGADGGAPHRTARRTDPCPHRELPPPSRRTDNPRPNMLALLAAAVACQAPALAPPRPPERIALPGGIAVTAADYLDHLYAAIGSARLRELLLDRVLARAVERIDPATLAPATAQALADPDAHARALRDARIAERHGGSRAAFRAHLAAIGITEDEDLWATRVDGLREARIAALVQAAREPTPARL